MREKVYILVGGSGCLGQELQKHLPVYAPQSVYFNLKWIPSAIFSYFNGLKIKKDILGVINCAAYTNVPLAEQERINAIEINIEGVKKLSDAVRQMWGVPFYHISTDYVYNPNRPLSKETDRPEPFNFYGWSKFAGEAYVENIYRAAFKPNNLWPEKYKVAFDDVYTSAEFVDVVAKDIALLVKNDIGGVINVGGQRKTVYELAKTRYPEVKPISVSEIEQKAGVILPRDCSMDISKLLGIKEDLLGR